MTPLGKAIRRVLEKALGRFEEGPTPPKRLREQVANFAASYPRATRGQWFDFAATFAEECYVAGYMRGVEWAEREPIDTALPERIADEIDPTWRDREWRPDMLHLVPTDGEVPSERSDEQAMQEQAAMYKSGPRRI